MKGGCHYDAGPGEILTKLQNSLQSGFSWVIHRRENRLFPDEVA